MTQQKKEQRLYEASMQYSTDEDERASFRDGVRSQIAKEYWQSQQKQETPELEEIKTEYYQRFASGDFQNETDMLDVDAAWNFFAPFIKGTDWVKIEVANPIQQSMYWACVKLGKHKRVKLVLRCDNRWMSNGHDWTDYVTHVMKYIEPKAPKEVDNG